VGDDLGEELLGVDEQLWLGLPASELQADPRPGGSIRAADPQPVRLEAETFQRVARLVLVVPAQGAEEHHLRVQERREPAADAAEADSAQARNGQLRQMG
jgi:hypothetical protein